MQKKYRIKLLLTLAVTLATSLILFYLILLLMRPPRTYIEQQLFTGIVHQRIPLSIPRPIMIHIVTIDLKAPGVRFFVTPGQPADDDMEFAAQTTEGFLRQYKLQLAINGSFFYPFYEHNPFSYYPKKGERVNVLGQVISDGKTYSKVQSGWAMLCFSHQQKVTIELDSCPLDTTQGLSGREIFIKDGKVIPQENSQTQQLFPRTAVAIDKSGQKLWLILVDGRQSFYSEGVTLPELTNIVMELNPHIALNLDGGGSTTLAILNKQKFSLLNSPIHTRIPLRQRPIANHLGIFAQPTK